MPCSSSPFSTSSSPSRINPWDHLSVPVGWINSDLDETQTFRTGCRQIEKLVEWQGEPFMSLGVMPLATRYSDFLQFALRVTKLRHCGSLLSYSSYTALVELVLYIGFFEVPFAHHRAEQKQHWDEEDDRRTSSVEANDLNEISRPEQFEKSEAFNAVVEEDVSAADETSLDRSGLLLTWDRLREQGSKESFEVPIRRPPPSRSLVLQAHGSCNTHSNENRSAPTSSAPCHSTSFTVPESPLPESVESRFSPDSVELNSVPRTNLVSTCVPTLEAAARDGRLKLNRRQLQDFLQENSSNDGNRARDRQAQSSSPSSFLYQ